ncbi:DUF3077 domain-containing protein [Pseudomonas sp. WOUb67]|uniref:DUF3077 domain-containing protein n=1 Tax=Pseudomonas sp. WOUb67 TaxID=3161136 RepID=UPI003CF7B1B8
MAPAQATTRPGKLINDNRNAREQASELMGYARDLTIDGLMEDKPRLIWAAHYLCALGKALLDDAELGMMR